MKRRFSVRWMTTTAVGERRIQGDAFLLANFLERMVTSLRGKGVMGEDCLHYWDFQVTEIAPSPEVEQ